MRYLLLFVLITGCCSHQCAWTIKHYSDYNDVWEGRCVNCGEMYKSVKRCHNAH